MKTRLFVLVVLFMIGDIAPLAAQQVCTSLSRLARDLVYDDSADPLDFVRSVVVDRSGNAIVSESDGNALKVFGVDGTLRARWGRTGEGPGEFRSVVSLLPVGDSIWAFDGELRRGTFFRRDGTVGRIVNLRQPLPRSQPYGEAYPLGNNYVVLPGLISSALATPEGFRRSVFAVTADGTAPPQDIVAPVLMRSVLMPLSLPGGGVTSLPSPVPQSDRAVVAPGGLSMVVARGEVQSSGRRFIVLTQIDQRGDTLWSQRYEVPLARAEPSFLERELDRAVQRFQRAYPSPAAARRAIQQVWKPHDHFWPIAWMFVDNDGRTWTKANPDSNQWLIIGPARQLACVTGLADTRLVASAADKVWGIRTDNDGVQYLERYALALVR